MLNHISIFFSSNVVSTDYVNLLKYVGTFTDEFWLDDYEMRSFSMKINRVYKIFPSVRRKMIKIVNVYQIVLYGNRVEYF